MKILIGVAVFLLMLPVPAHAATVRYQNAQMILTLRDSACASKDILAMIQDNFQAKFRAADLTWQGKQLAACWMPMPQQPGQEKLYVIIDETGDKGFLPASAFRPVDPL